MRRIAFLVLLLAVGSCVSSEQRPTFSSELAAAVEPIFAKWDSDDSPGMTVGILQDGHFLYLRGFGMADLEHGIANDADTVFRIASTSKQFTASCIALLLQRGQVRMETTLASLFPEFPQWAEEVQVQHLLFHISGIPDYLDLHEEDFFTPQASLRIIGEQGSPTFAPGTQFYYSNSNYLLLAEIVTRVSGVAFPEFVQREIFTPLVMEHSHFHDDINHIIPGAAHGYGRYGRSTWEVYDTDLEHVGDGGLFTSVRDLALWDANFYNPKVGGVSWLARMTTPGWNTEMTKYGQESYSFGLGIIDDKDLGPIFLHAGSWSGFNAEMIRIPAEHMTVIVLSNCDSASASQLAMEVVEVVLELP